MAYQGTLSGKQTLILENQGNQTTIRLSGGGQQQSSSLSTGAWSGQPSVYQTDDGAVMEIKMQDASVFYSIKDGQLQSLGSKPDLGNAKAVDLKKVADGSGKSDMEPMKPMKPMKPM